MPGERDAPMQVPTLDGLGDEKAAKEEIDQRVRVGRSSILHLAVAQAFGRCDMQTVDDALYLRHSGGQLQRQLL